MLLHVLGTTTHAIKRLLHVEITGDWIWCGALRLYSGDPTGQWAGYRVI